MFSKRAFMKNWSIVWWRTVFSVEKPCDWSMKHGIETSFSLRIQEKLVSSSMKFECQFETIESVSFAWFSIPETQALSTSCHFIGVYLVNKARVWSVYDLFFPIPPHSIQNPFRKFIFLPLYGKSIKNKHRERVYTECAIHIICFALDIRSESSLCRRKRQIDRLAKGKHVSLAQFDWWRIYNFIATILLLCFSRLGEYNERRCTACVYIIHSNAVSATLHLLSIRCVHFVYVFLRCTDY